VTQEDSISPKAVVSGSGNREVTSRLQLTPPKLVAWFGRFLRRLGLGLVTGAADDDPSGIATYAQVGAQFGPSMLWTMPFVYPFMAAIQEISARLGRVTGRGIAGNMRHF
jgi:Mn2+/Fe2+ NRAMP family transporter